MLRMDFFIIGEIHYSQLKLRMEILLNEFLPFGNLILRRKVHWNRCIGSDQSIQGIDIFMIE